MTSSLSRRFRRADSADEDEVTERLWGSDPRRADGPALVLQQDHADAVTFPIYAAEGWPARINGQGSRGDDLTHLTIAHAETLPDSMFVERPQIEITTSIDPYRAGELAVARDAFASGMETDTNRRPTEGLSDAALTLWFRAGRRQRAAGSHEAPVSETEITIDGARELFVMVGTPNARWVAVRRHNDVTITIAAREIDPAPLIIEPIADPAARLLGPEPDEP
jgi:hypothetical protein